MLFADMLLEVYDITKRADLVAETTLALKKATVKFHHVDFFARDLAEVALVVPTPGSLVTVDIVADLPQFRAIAYIRDGASGTPNVASKLFTRIEPRAILDEYSLEKNDVWYQGGQSINIKSSTTLSTLLVGYYKSPIVTPTVSYSSWIADEQPYFLIEEAAASVFRMIGQAEMARFYDQQAMQNIILLRQNYLEGVAR